MPDEKTILGTEYSTNFSTLLMEDIAGNETCIWKSDLVHKSINLIIPNHDYSSFLVGDESNQIVQYYFKKPSFELICTHKYYDLPIDKAISCTRFGNLFFFAGKNGYITALDIYKKQNVFRPVKMALPEINSLQICVVSQN